MGNKNITATFVFDRRKVADKTKVKGLIQIEIYHDRKRKYLSTGVKVYKDQWTDKTMVKNTTQSVVLNEQLNTMMSVVNGYINKCISGEEIFNFDNIPNITNVNSDSENDFLEYLDKYVEHKKSTTKMNTYALYLHFSKKVKQSNIFHSFADITLKNITRFDEWLNSQDLKDTTINSHHRRFTSVLLDAVKQGLIPKNPYVDFRFKPVKSAMREYLTEEELKAVTDLKLSDTMQIFIRDCFVFQCYTGLAFADLQSFDKNKIVDKNGHKFYLDERIKTGEVFYLMMLKPAVEILERYDYKFELPSHMHYNRTLKKIADKAGIIKNVSSHTGRHTFAVMCLNKGVSIENLAKMMGHTDIKTTQIYAKILNKSVEDAFMMLDDKL